MSKKKTREIPVKWKLVIDPKKFKPIRFCEKKASIERFFFHQLPKHSPVNWEQKIKERKLKLEEKLKGKTYLEKSRTIRKEGLWAKSYINSPALSKPDLFQAYDRFLAELHRKEKRLYLDRFLRDYTKSDYFPDSMEIELHVSTEPEEKPLRFGAKELFDQQSELAHRELNNVAFTGGDLKPILTHWKEEWNNWKIRGWVYGDLLDTLNKHMEALEGAFDTISRNREAIAGHEEYKAEKQPKREPAAGTTEVLSDEFFEWLRGQRGKANLFLLACRVSKFDVLGEKKKLGNKRFKKEYSKKTGLTNMDETCAAVEKAGFKIESKDDLLGTLVKTGINRVEILLKKLKSAPLNESCKGEIGLLLQMID